MRADRPGLGRVARLEPELVRAVEPVLLLFGLEHDLVAARRRRHTSLVVVVAVDELAFHDRSAIQRREPVAVRRRRRHRQQHGAGVVEVRQQECVAPKDAEQGCTRPLDAELTDAVVREAQRLRRRRSVVVDQGGFREPHELAREARRVDADRRPGAERVQVVAEEVGVFAVFGELVGVRQVGEAELEGGAAGVSGRVREQVGDGGGAERDGFRNSCSLDRLMIMANGAINNDRDIGSHDPGQDRGRAGAGWRWTGRDRARIRSGGGVGQAGPSRRARPAALTDDDDAR